MCLFTVLTKDVLPSNIFIFTDSHVTLTCRQADYSRVKKY